MTALTEAALREIRERAEKAKRIITKSKGQTSPLGTVYNDELNEWHDLLTDLLAAYDTQAQEIARLRTWIDEIKVGVDFLKTEIARKDAALKPFAECLHVVGQFAPDHKAVTISVSARDLRAAAAHEVKG